MVNKKHIALKSALAAYFESGIFKTRTQTLLKNASSRPQPVWRQLKSEIGSRIDDNVTGPLLRRTGKLLFINAQPWCFESPFLKEVAAPSASKNSRKYN